MKKKEQGNSDFFASIIVIFALSILMIGFVNIMRDLNTKTTIDQVARQYILKLETNGELTSTDIDKLKTDLLNINAVAQVAGKDDIKVVYNTNNTKRSYGEPVTLSIDCPSRFTMMPSDAADMTQLNINGTTHYIVNKQSTAKY